MSVVLALGSQACAVLMAWLTGTTLESVLTSRSTHDLWVLIGLIFVVGLIRAVLMFGRRMISGNQALGVEFDMRNALYAKLVRLPFGFYDRHQTGQLMSRATVDLQTVRFFLGYGLIFFFQHILTVVGATAVMFFVNWRLALVATAITPFVVVLAYRYSHVSHPVLRDVQQKLGDVATVAEENIVGVHVVKSFAQEGAESAKFERALRGRLRPERPREPAARDLRAAARRSCRSRAGRRAARRRPHGRQAASSRSASSSPSTCCSLMLVMPLRMLGMWIGQAQRATASGERIFEIIDEPEEIRDAPDAAELPPGDGPRPLRGRLVRATPTAGRCCTTSTSRSRPATRWR